MRAEITLNGLQLSILDSEILHVAEGFTVLGVAKIFHKSILRASGDSLQVKMSNEIDLGFPALRFERALADVVVAGRAGRPLKRFVLTGNGRVNPSEPAL